MRDPYYIVNEQLVPDLEECGFTFGSGSDFFIVLYNSEVMYRFREDDYSVERIIFQCVKNLEYSSWCKDERRREPRRKLINLLIGHLREKFIDEIMDSEKN